MNNPILCPECHSSHIHIHTYEGEDGSVVLVLNCMSCDYRWARLGGG